MNPNRAWTTYESPFGSLTLTADAQGSIDGLFFPESAPSLEERHHHPRAFARAVEQLDEYFAGDRRQFDLALGLASATPFQQAVWRELATIPYGTTLSYAQLAARLGRSGAVRAVGAAVGRNPLPIIVPCHRVIGADGGLTGYLGGLHRKRALLDTERAAPVAVDGTVGSGRPAGRPNLRTDQRGV